MHQLGCSLFVLRAHPISPGIVCRFDEGDPNPSLMTNRLQQQIRFLMEIDKLKTILRRSYLLHEARRENAAEHSWHLALMAITLAEHAADTIDPLKVIKMMVDPRHCGNRRGRYLLL